MSSSLNFGVRLPRELAARADARAEVEDRTRTQIVRRALKQYLDRSEDEGRDREPERKQAA
jgi:predicted transcriptional regulator